MTTNDKVPTPITDALVQELAYVGSEAADESVKRGGDAFDSAMAVSRARLKAYEKMVMHAGEMEAKLHLYEKAHNVADEHFTQAIGIADKAVAFSIKLQAQLTEANGKLVEKDEDAEMLLSTAQYALQVADQHLTMLYPDGFKDGDYICCVVRTARGQVDQKAPVVDDDLPKEKEELYWAMVTWLHTIDNNGYHTNRERQSARILRAMLLDDHVSRNFRGSLI